MCFKDLKKTFLAGFAASIVIFVLSFALQALVQLVFSYDVLSLGGMRSVNDPIMALFFAHPFVLGFGLTIAYELLMCDAKGDSFKKGKRFGAAAWLIGGLPNAFIVFSSMNYPLGFTVNSVVGSFVHFVAASLVIARILG